MSEPARTNQLGRAAGSGALIGAGVGVALLLVVTAYWLGLNIYLETQKPVANFPDLLSPLVYFVLYSLVAALPAAAVGALIALALRALVPAKRARFADTDTATTSER